MKELNVKEFQEQRNSYQQYDLIELLKSFQKKINRNLYVATLAVVNDVNNELITCTPFPIRKDDRVNTIIAYNLTQRVVNEGDKVLILFTDRDFRDTYVSTTTNENTIGETNDENLHSQAYGIIIQCLGEDGTGGDKITIDNELSPTSTNPVQNKIIYNALQDIIDDIETNANNITNLNNQVEQNANDISNIENTLEDKADKTELDKYVTLTTNQTISGVKTFTANNRFTGSNTFTANNSFTGVNNFTAETQFKNASYAPTWRDISYQIGKSSLFTRGAFMQEIVAQIIAPNQTMSDSSVSFESVKDNIKFQYITKNAGKNPTLADLATLSPSGLSVSGSSLTVNGTNVALSTDLKLTSEEIDIEW